MKVIWDPDAKSEFKRIIDYLNENFGKTSAQKFVNQVIKTRNIIAQNPQTFKIEELMQNRQFVYRSVNVGKINRLIYYVDNNIVHIADIWDNRRDPKKMQAKKLEPRKNYMEILGYSERGVMNALFYGIAYKGGKNDIDALLGLCDYPTSADYDIIMEASLSDFGDPDAIIIGKDSNGKETNVY